MNIYIYKYSVSIIRWKIKIWRISIFEWQKPWTILPFVSSQLSNLCIRLKFYIGHSKKAIYTDAMLFAESLLCLWMRAQILILNKSLQVQVLAWAATNQRSFLNKTGRRAETLCCAMGWNLFWSSILILIKIHVPTKRLTVSI